MRKAIVIAMVFAFMFIVTTPLMALPEPIVDLKDHVVDIVSSPLEVTHYAKEEYDGADFKPFGLIGGIMKGTFYAVHKAGTGVVDIIKMPLSLIK